MVAVSTWPSGKTIAQRQGVHAGTGRAPRGKRRPELQLTSRGFPYARAPPAKKSVLATSGSSIWKPSLLLHCFGPLVVPQRLAVDAPKSVLSSSRLAVCCVWRLLCPPSSSSFNLRSSFAKGFPSSSSFNNSGPAPSSISVTPMS